MIKSVLHTIKADEAEVPSQKSTQMTRMRLILTDKILIKKLHTDDTDVAKKKSVKIRLIRVIRVP